MQYVAHVKSNQDRRQHARDYVSNLAVAGRYHFTSGDARKALGVSPDAVKLALNRLTHQKLIASPARGFYVIVPPEYRPLGGLPADQFIPVLMERRGLQLLGRPVVGGTISWCRASSPSGIPSHAG